MSVSGAIPASVGWAVSQTAAATSMVLPRWSRGGVELYRLCSLYRHPHMSEHMSVHLSTCLIVCT